MRHERATTTPALSCALLIAALAAGCHEEKKVASPSEAGQRRERVAIEAPPVRDTAEQDIQNSRASVLRVGTDTRDAITAPFPGTITLDLPASGSEQLASALAITGWPREKLPPSLSVQFDFDFAGPKRVQKSSISLTIREAVSGWSPVLLQRGNDGEAVKMTLRASWIALEPPKNVPPLRVALALPDVAVLGKPAGDAPNVLVISIDTLRADHLGCYGYPRETSPHIDALVARGALFENAYSSAPWTLPSYGSLFTGLLPADHRAGIVREREAAWGSDAPPQGRTTEHLRPDVPTLAELLAAHGYQTAGFVCNPFLGEGSGVARGFQEYASYQYNSQNGVDLALEWMGGRKGTRWFAFLHVIDPHMPYAPPAPYDVKFAKVPFAERKNWPPDLAELRAHEPDAATKEMLVDDYDGEIAFVDAQIGRPIEALEAGDMLQDTLIVLHSDHGEEFWEHGSCDHGHTQYDELLHVPLALVYPGKIEAGTKVTTRVRTLDLLPTIAQYAGFAPPAGIAGKSLVPALADPRAPDRDSLSEAILHGEREIKALMQGRMKLIAAGAESNQLYDLSADPFERRDRSEKEKETVRTMRAVLEAHHAEAAKSAGKAAPLEVDESTRRRLGQYGYGGAGIPVKKP